MWKLLLLILLLLSKRDLLFHKKKLENALRSPQVRKYTTRYEDWYGKELKSYFSMKRNLQHESDHQEPFFWVFEDGDCLPRDSFNPKQESDKRRPLILQVSYKTDHLTTLQKQFIKLVCRGPFGGKWARYDLRIRRLQGGTAVLSSCYLYKRQFRANQKKSAIV